MLISAQIQQAILDRAISDFSEDELSEIFWNSVELCRQIPEEVFSGVDKILAGEEDD